MAVLPLRYHPDPVLRQRAKRVKNIGDSALQQLIDDMVDTMRAVSGVGLAAPQVGIPLRLAVIELPESTGGPIVLVNPQIVSRTQEQDVEEGCLSLPGFRGNIKRSLRVTVRARDRHGKEIRVKGEGLLAEALEHELDHLNGVLYIDHVQEGETPYKVVPKQEK